MLFWSCQVLFGFYFDFLIFHPEFSVLVRFIIDLSGFGFLLRPDLRGKRTSSLAPADRDHRDVHVQVPSIPRLVFSFFFVSVPGSGNKRTEQSKK